METMLRTCAAPPQPPLQPRSRHPLTAPYQPHGRPAPWPDPWTAGTAGSPGLSAWRGPEAFRRSVVV